MRALPLLVSLALAACSSSASDPPDEHTDAAVQASTPDCASRDATCAKVLARSVALECHDGEPRALIQECQSSSTPAKSDGTTWLCCRDAQ